MVSSVMRHLMNHSRAPQAPLILFFGNLNICPKFKLNFYADTEWIIMEHFDSGPSFIKGRLVCVFKQESCTFLWTRSIKFGLYQHVLLHTMSK